MCFSVSPVTNLIVLISVVKFFYWGSRFLSGWQAATGQSCPVPLYTFTQLKGSSLESNQWCCPVPLYTTKATTAVGSSPLWLSSSSAIDVLRQCLLSVKSICIYTLPTEWGHDLTQ